MEGNLEGGLNCLDVRAEEEMGSLAWMATGYFLLALPMAEPVHGEELEELEGGGAWNTRKKKS